MPCVVLPTKALSCGETTGKSGCETDGLVTSCYCSGDRCNDPGAADGTKWCNVGTAEGAHRMVQVQCGAGVQNCKVSTAG